MKKDIVAPESIKRQFPDWHTRIYGKSNPENQTNDVWKWIFQNRLGAYKARKILTGKSETQPKNPTWSMDRFGQSCTVLPDGRKVYIAGEHEDFYDPDFCVYNDVIVEHSDGDVAIYGYPEDVFPPTDFHSATLVGDQIYIVGNAYYEGDFDEETTPVYVLDTNTWKISPFLTSGDVPHQLSSQEAELSQCMEEIYFQGGNVTSRKSRYHSENVDKWCLNIKTGVWRNITNYGWQRWLIVRKDGKCNELYKIEQAYWYSQLSEKSKSLRGTGRDRELLKRNFDFQTFENRYSPPIPHKTLEEKEDEDAFRVYEIEVNGVVVSYKEDDWAVEVIIRGDIPENLVKLLQEDLVQKLSKLEDAPYKIEIIN